MDFDEFDFPEFSEVEVGPMEEYEERIPLEDVASAEAEIRLGAGELLLTAGEEELLFSGDFRTNVADWAPEVTWNGGILRVAQGDDEGFPNSNGVENEWELRFSPDVVWDMDLEIGASDGELDFTGLPLSRLHLDTGASNTEVNFGEPNTAEMDELRIRAGATSLEVEGIGNASPEEVRVEGGVGDLRLNFSGEWRNSATVRVTTGAGSLVLRFPEGVGVRVETESGISSINTEGEWTRSGDAYVNEAYGDAEIELIVDLSVGVGSVELETVGE
jgi:hypothetical protein